MIDRRKSHQPDTKPLTPVHSGFDEQLVINTIFDHAGNATTRELSRELGVSASTLVRWMKEFPAINSAVREMRSYVDDGIESALAKRAKGYTAYETITKTEDDSTTVTEKEIHIAPDVGAAKFWLTNRRPDQWADKQTVEVSGNLQHILSHLDEVFDLAATEYKDETDAS